MTTTQAPPSATPGGHVAERPSVEDRLDHLSGQVDELVAEMRRQREQREQWAELSHELAPVTRDAVAAASRELAELSQDVTIDDLTEFARQLAKSLPKMRAMLVQLDSMAELTHEVNSIAGAGVAKLSESLAEAEAKGYFTFARHGADMVDEIVSSFSEEDVIALRENIVLILNTVKELTQPEVMTLLHNTGISLQTIGEDEGPEPPTTFALLRQMRDPKVRRGLGRTLSLLRSVGEDQPAIPGQAPPPPPTT
jgi:uncharacterized protein YjgD (DUF1641 family)